MWRQAIVVAVALLAGCSGLIEAGTSLDDDPTVTPAPVPTSSGGETVAVPSSNGAVDVDRLLDRHELALENRSFHRHVEREGPQNTFDVWVDRDADVRRVRQRFGPLTDDAVVTNGTLYQNVRDDPETPYTSRPIDSRTPYVSSLPGRSLLETVLAGQSYRQTDTFTWDGHTVALLEATETRTGGVTRTAQATGTNDSTVVRSRVYVDRQGVIRYVDHQERRLDQGDLQVVMTVETDLERVPIPWWLADDDPYDVSGSM